MHIFVLHSDQHLTMHFTAGPQAGLISDERIMHTRLQALSGACASKSVDRAL